MLWLISIVNLVWLGDAQSICKFSARVFEGFDESRRQGTDLMNGFIAVRFTVEVKFRAGGTVEEETASMQVSDPCGGMTDYSVSSVHFLFLLCLLPAMIFPWWIQPEESTASSLPSAVSLRQPSQDQEVGALCALLTSKGLCYQSRRVDRRRRLRFYRICSTPNFSCLCFSQKSSFFIW